MKETILNHYTDFSVIRNEQFIEKEKLVIWLDDLIRKNTFTAQKKYEHLNHCAYKIFFNFLMQVSL